MPSTLDRFRIPLNRLFLSQPIIQMDNISVFCFDISHWPSWMVLLLGVFGIFSTFLVQGMAHELVFVEYQVHEVLAVTTIQFLCYCSFSSMFFVRLFTGKASLKCPFSQHLITSIALCGSMFLGNFAVSLLSFPTQVLFRSSKMIPVMIGGVIFLKKRYSIVEIISVIILVIGLIGISMSDKFVQNTFGTDGLLIVVISLVCDAVASNMQEKSLKVFEATQGEVIAMIYLIGAVFLGSIAGFKGEFGPLWGRCQADPAVLRSILLLAMLGAMGVEFVYLMIKAFGSLTTVMLTSLRKAFTVCLSFVMFSNKRFSVFHGVSIAIIAVGIGMNAYAKRIGKKEVLGDKMCETAPFLPVAVKEETSDKPITQ
jgi:adenosine 3'-phospho 5'-phosphosulfate transporter B3